MVAKIMAAQKYNREKIVLYSVVAFLLLMMMYQQFYLFGFKKEVSSGFQDVQDSQRELSKTLNTKITQIAEQNQEAVGEVAGSVRRLEGNLGELKSSSESRLGELQKELSTVKSAGGDFSGIIEEVIKGVVS